MSSRPVPSPLVHVVKWSVQKVQGQVGGKKGWSMNDGDTVPIPVDNKYSDTQPMPLLKQANVTTEAIRKQGTVGPV